MARRRAVLNGEGAIDEVQDVREQHAGEEQNTSTATRNTVLALL
jgi:hypothetical protein